MSGNAKAVLITWRDNFNDLSGGVTRTVHLVGLISKFLDTKIDIWFRRDTPRSLLLAALKKVTGSAYLREARFKYVDLPDLSRYDIVIADHIRSLISIYKHIRNNKKLIYIYPMIIIRNFHTME